MKKALAILMILALVGSAAFAEISFGAWGRGIFLPYIDDGVNDPTADTKSTWGGAPRIGFTVNGVSDNVGFQIDLNADGALDNDSENNFLTYGDQQKIWVKPISMLKVELGRVYDDTLRGNACFGVFDWYRPYGTWTGEDVIFDRISSGSYGLVVSATPAEGIYAAIALRDVNGGLQENEFKNIQLAAGYTIAGIGQIRGQYISSYDADADDTAGTIEVAFKVTAVENLYADIGLKMPTNTDLQGETKTVAAYANYKIDAAKLHGLVVYNLNEEDDGFEIGAGVDYSLNGGVGVAADVRYFNAVQASGDPDGDAKTTFFAGITKGFSNGLIGAGVEVANATDTGFAVPVRLEYWF